MFKKIIFIGVLVIATIVKAQNISSTFYFEFDKVQFTKESEVAFQKFVTTLQKGTEISIEVSSDSVGKQKYNQELSNKRLKYVTEKFGSDIIISNKRSIVEDSINLDQSLNRKAVIEVINQRKVIQKIDDSEKISLRTEGIKEKINSNQGYILNVRFVGGESIFLDYDSFEEVLAFAEYLKENPEKRVLIRGHVCCSDNMLLSTQRALRVYNELIKAGIDQSRLEYKGYSNSMLLINPDNTVAANTANRRVDIVFLD